jgi:hypothetical protein
MRLPVESRSIAVESLRPLIDSASWATKDLTFVLMTDMLFLLNELTSTKSSFFGGLELLTNLVEEGFHLLHTLGRKVLFPY